MPTDYDKFLLPDDDTITLPSGMPCILRNPSGEYFLRIGALPGGRIATAISQGTDVETVAKEDDALREAVKKEIEETPAAGWSEEKIQQWRDGMQRTGLLAVDIFVKPVFSLDPKPGEIHPRRLRPEDRIFIHEWANKRMSEYIRGGRADMETFPAGSAKGDVVAEGVREMSSAAR